MAAHSVGCIPATGSRYPSTHLLSSDGLWDFATDERVMHITLKQPQRTPDEICNALIREARMGGSEDDCTIVVVRCVVWVSGAGGNGLAAPSSI